MATQQDLGKTEVDQQDRGKTPELAALVELAIVAFRTDPSYASQILAAGHRLANPGAPFVLRPGTRRPTGIQKRKGNKWQATVWRGGRTVYLGQFDTEDEAILARLAAD